MISENQTPKVYRVSQLTSEIQSILESRFDLIWVEGEISNFSAPSSGHLYMVIKDEKAQIRAVMFRIQARYLKFTPENGMHVLAQGRIGVYPPRGEYQIILDYLEPMGVGALALAFEQLKKKLAAQGVFDADIKKPLPFLPQRVAVITSPSGAAVRDFLNVIGRRFANMEIIIVPVRVQGAEACPDMIKALELVNRELDVDVIVLTRGGGSLEDLWAFNQEELAHAVRRSNIPVVSAVGHEIDITICDLAADFRAPTPSAAAELLVVEKETLLAQLKDLKDRLISSIGRDIRDYRQELGQLTKRLKDPRKKMDETWMRLDELYLRLVRNMGVKIRERQRDLAVLRHALQTLSPANLVSAHFRQLGFLRESLTRAMQSYLRSQKAFLTTNEKRMADLSPLSVLKRGYSITRKLPEQHVLKDAADVMAGDQVQVLLAAGELLCRVVEPKD